MPSIQVTVPNDKGSQKFTIGEIARMILETHQSSPTVDAQIVITEILNQVEVGEPPGIKPDKEIILLAAAGHPYKSAASATRAARTRADLQGIVWDIVSVDGGWAIRDISTYTNWFEYWADKNTLTADEISYKVLVSTADMMRLCRSTGYREWASPLGLGVPLIFGGEGTPLAKGQEDAPAQTVPPHDEPDPQEPAEIPVPEGSEDEPGTLSERAEGWLETMEGLRGTQKISWRKAADQIAESAGVDSATVEREARRKRQERDRAGEKSGEKSGENF